VLRSNNHSLMKQAVWEFLYRFFPRHGHHLVQDGFLYDWQKDPTLARGTARGGEKDDYLRPDNPRLKELRERYTAFDQTATTPIVWSPGHVTEEDLRNFRGADIYVWQSGGLNYGLLAHVLTYYHVLSRDRLGLLKRLTDDPAFAVRLFEVDGRPVSRDLLDSVLEINLIDREIGLASKSGLKVLDIGAGYGRLAHRMAEALPNLEKHFCTDAVPESTFLCEHYLRYRGVEDKTRVVPLDEIEKTLAATPVDLAVNIHSFSECSLEAIDWWAGLLAKHRVPWLVVCPNAKHDEGRFLGVEDGRPFAPCIEKHGYELAKLVPKYDDPSIQAYGLDPSWFHIFRLKPVA
jgi:SAM-dependent methyltransferase